jgi:hypothetical protein
VDIVAGQVVTVRALSGGGDVEVTIPLDDALPQPVTAAPKEKAKREVDPNKPKLMYDAEPVGGWPREPGKTRKIKSGRCPLCLQHLGNHPVVRCAPPNDAR